MRCNKCGATLLKSDFCPECGIDVSFYKKATKASNFYYNEGLEKARVRDLSGAIESLKQSLLFDKTNVKARNLLGLCYFEMGEATEALSHFIISKSFQSEGNLAVSYIDKIQAKKTDFDIKTATIRKYNQVLLAAKKENYDVAFIQLKKIVAHCPNFIKGELLLALFYIEKKSFARAEKCIKNVLKIDSSNVKAKQYLQEINKHKEGQDQPTLASIFKRENKNQNENTKPLSGNDVILPKNNYRGSYNGAFSLINILIGIAVGASIVFFLVVPASKQSLIRKFEASEGGLELSKANENLTIANKEIEKLKVENESIKNEMLNNAKAGNASTKDMTALIKGANLYLKDNKVDTARALCEIDNIDLLPDGAPKTLYTTLSNATFKASSDVIANDGVNLFNAGNIDEAIQQLLIAYKCNNENTKAAYYLGTAFAKKNDVSNAKKYYQVVADANANTNEGKEALSYISSHQ